MTDEPGNHLGRRAMLGAGAALIGWGLAPAGVAEAQTAAAPAAAPPRRRTRWW